MAFESGVKGPVLKNIIKFWETDPSDETSLYKQYIGFTGWIVIHKESGKSKIYPVTNMDFIMINFRNRTKLCYTTRWS